MVLGLILVVHLGDAEGPLHPVVLGDRDVLALDEAVPVVLEDRLLVARRGRRVVVGERPAPAAVDGHVLRARSLPPGPIYRQILRDLRDARLDGKIGTDEEEMEILGRWLHEQGIRDPE